MLIKNKVSIIGLGYVGMPLAKLFKKNKFEVVGITKHKKSLDGIISHQDFKKISDSSNIFICVPTPVDNKNNPDLSILKEVTEKIGKNLKKSQTIILESTVNPGVSNEVVIPILEKESGLFVEKDFFYAHCPERINPGDRKWTVENIPRVIGADSSNSLIRAMSICKKILKGKITQTKNIKEAEAVKIVENAFRDINIAFVNELAMSFSKLDIDILNVINAASTKPFSFMPHYPGIGVGGHCIPVDPYYLINSAKSKGFSHDFLMLARRINNFMPSYTLNLLKNELKLKNISIDEAKISVLGLSYKAGIDDTRGSPSLKLIRLLKKEGFRVNTFDPKLKSLSSSNSLGSAIKDTDAVIIATDHKEFIAMPISTWVENTKIIIDGRNCLDKEKLIRSGVIYRGIGR